MSNACAASCSRSLDARVWCMQRSSPRACTARAPPGRSQALLPHARCDDRHTIRVVRCGCPWTLAYMSAPGGTGHAGVLKGQLSRVVGRHAWTMLRRRLCSEHGGRSPTAGSQAAVPPTRPANGIWPPGAPPLATHRLRTQAAGPGCAGLAQSLPQSSHPVWSCRRVAEGPLCVCTAAARRRLAWAAAAMPPLLTRRTAAVRPETARSATWCDGMLMS